MDFSPFLQKAQNDKHLFVILTCLVKMTKSAVIVKWRQIVRKP